MEGREGRRGESRGWRGVHMLNTHYHNHTTKPLTLCEDSVGGLLGVACLVQHHIKELVP